MKIIFCDGIFDFFHQGHLKHLKKIHQYFDEPIYLIVGVINDRISADYKRKPILPEKHRYNILKSCLYVNEVILLDYLHITQDFMEKYNIDYVVHSFADSSDKDNQYEFYNIPIKNNKFIALDYNKGISTTSIIKETGLNWKDIWEKKGNIDTQDMMLLNGWELTEFRQDQFVKKIIDIFDIKPSNSILEMGCGAGALAKEFDKFISHENYIGVDASLSLVRKHLEYLDHSVLHFNADDTIFKTNYFDFSVCNSMLEYLTSQEELNRVVQELERVSSKAVYFGSIRFISRTKKTKKHIYDGKYTHFIVPKQYFIDRGYTISSANCDKTERYDAFKILK
jgi:cytidyltransferase-like protein